MAIGRQREKEEHERQKTGERRMKAQGKALLTSPVIAISCRTGRWRARDRRAVVMVHPAEGPSFGVAPSGTCKWMCVWSKN